MYGWMQAVKQAGLPAKNSGNFQSIDVSIDFDGDREFDGTTTTYVVLSRLVRGRP
jgi:hypothetical protein